jgi:hypothetical protein
VIRGARGQVEIVGLSGGRIPWPVSKRGRAKPFVQCGALAKAVRLESAIAVAYWCGIPAQTVTLWRRKLVCLPTLRYLKVAGTKVTEEGLREIGRVRWTTC